MNAIHHLHLTAFRNHTEFVLSPEGRSVILTGPNGAGKTNILEAISLLSPGRGLRRAKLGEMTFALSHDDGDNRLGWVISARVNSLQGEAQIGTGLDVEARTDRRLVKIDGKNTSQAALSKHLAILWQTPQMDGLFLSSGTVRRAFLDRLVYTIDSAHASRVAAYEQAMRDRNRLLADMIRDEAWLNALEMRMSTEGIAIAAARNETLTRLNNTMLAAPTSFPKASLAIDGMIENQLREGMSAIDAEMHYLQQLSAARPRDAAAGRALTGIHRSMLQTHHLAKDREAANCSTGEQKALLLAILLANARARADWLGAAPILLLDEVVAHLDIIRRRELFREIEDLNAQAWLTGTDAADFSTASENGYSFIRL